MLCWTRLRRPNRSCCRAVVAVVPVGQQIYCFGGLNDYNNYLDEEIIVYIFDTVSSSWSELPSVCPRGTANVPTVPILPGHTAVLVGNIIYLWGGHFPPSRSGRVYAFDVDSHRWLLRKASGPFPEARTNHSACVLGKFMYVHGGQSTWHDPRIWYDDTHKLDTTTMIWTSIVPGGAPPPASALHSATIMGTKMFVFGGFYSGCYNDTVRVFDTETDCWLSTPYTVPVPDERMAQAAFARHGELYIFGGHDYRNAYGPLRIKDDMWKFNPKTISWKKVEPKGECPYQSQKGIAAAWCCTVGDRIITYTDDLYVLDLTHLSLDCPSLKTLCMGSVVQYGADWSELPRDLRLELVAMTRNVKKEQEKRAHFLKAWHEREAAICAMENDDNYPG